MKIEFQTRWKKNITGRGNGVVSMKTENGEKRKKKTRFVERENRGNMGREFINRERESSAFENENEIEIEIRRNLGRI